jgi:hypothetical protein
MATPRGCDVYLEAKLDGRDLVECFSDRCQVSSGFQWIVAQLSIQYIALFSYCDSRFLAQQHYTIAFYNDPVLLTVPLGAAHGNICGGISKPGQMPFIFGILR